MPKNNGYDDYEEHHHQHENGAGLTLRVIIPIVFLTSGLVLLSLRIPGWSIIFGLPLIVFGTVFLVYTYDEIVTRTVKPIPEKIVECSICGKPTTKLYPWQDEKDVICQNCREDIAKGVKMLHKSKKS